MGWGVVNFEGNHFLSSRPLGPQIIGKLLMGGHFILAALIFETPVKPLFRFLGKNKGASIIYVRGGVGGLVRSSSEGG